MFLFIKCMVILIIFIFVLKVWLIVLILGNVGKSEGWILIIWFLYGLSNVELINCIYFVKIRNFILVDVSFVRIVVLYVFLFL